MFFLVWLERKGGEQNGKAKVEENPRRVKEEGRNTYRRNYTR